MYISRDVLIRRAFDCHVLCFIGSELQRPLGCQRFLRRLADQEIKAGKIVRYITFFTTVKNDVSGDISATDDVRTKPERVMSNSFAARFFVCVKQE